MKRAYLSLIAIVAVATGFAMMPTTKAAVAAKPTPTPTPVALQYDELVRMIIPPATAPPPGVFQADYKVAMGSGESGAATPTPAPRRRGIGGMIGSIMSGNIPGAGGTGGNPMDMMRQMQAGHVTRFTYYYSKGWIRTEDPVAQTATISKCNEHQFITLDLAHKTYTMTNTAPRNCPTMPMGPMGPHRTTVENEAPGTADMTMKTTSKNLGPKTLEGIATTGHDNAFEMSMTNATGSCHNGDMQMQSTVYVSGIRKPRAYCPIAASRPVPQSPEDVVVHGGCKPRMHTSAAGGMGYNSDFLEMYIKMSMAGGENAQQTQSPRFSSVTERGNVAWLYKSQADPLFEIPPGFTEAR